jgi:hypothetical protein
MRSQLCLVVQILSLCSESNRQNTKRCVILFATDHSGGTVEVRSVFDSSNTGALGSNSTRNLDVCVCLFCVGRGLATGRYPAKRVLPTVYRTRKLKKRPRPKNRAV